MTRERTLKVLRSLLASALLNTPLLAQTMPAARYDTQIEINVQKKLAGKKQFQNVTAATEDGIVTLTGSVDLYQRKLDVAKLARKVSNVQGVRNLVMVAGQTVSDEQLSEKLAKKLTYVRSGYDSTFDYFAMSVKNGVVTVTGDDRTGEGRDEALADVYKEPGVKDVINQVAVEPTSIFDDGVRLRTAHAIYSDPVLTRYAIDPARPIRIIVIDGHVTLYGSVDNAVDRNVAGIRASQVFGAFSVDNKLVVRGNPADQPGM